MGTGKGSTGKGGTTGKVAGGKVPAVREVAAQVVGIFCADLHFSEHPPVFRSVENDWLEVQWGYCNQLRELQSKYGAPIFIAGDLFDRWNSSAHLVGHVLKWFRGMEIYTIPGNHDVPAHNYRELTRSAYWCLVEAGVVHHLTVGTRWPVNQLVIHAFPYGSPVTPNELEGGLHLDVALVHAYIWTKSTGHKDAPESQRLANYLPQFKGYNAVVTGDNHLSFLIQKERQVVYNPGTFLRRTVSDKDSKPNVGLLYSTGEIKRHYLNCSEDKFLDMSEELSTLEKSLELDLSAFAEELANLHSEKLDYAKFVVHWLNKNSVPRDVKSVMLKALGVRK